MLQAMLLAAIVAAPLGSAGLFLPAPGRMPMSPVAWPAIQAAGAGA